MSRPARSRERKPEGLEAPATKRRRFFRNLLQIAKADKADKRHSASRTPKL